MNDHTKAQFAQRPADGSRPMTRIDNEVLRVKNMTDRVTAIRERIITHARTLGFFEPPTNGSIAGVPTPVISTLLDALNELDRELDQTLGALNVFD